MSPVSIPEEHQLKFTSLSSSEPKGPGNFPPAFFSISPAYVPPQLGYQDTKRHYVKGLAKGTFCFISKQPFISLQKATKDDNFPK